MITKIKMLLGAFVLGIGLSGCIVIPDEEMSYYSYSSYSPYPIGSYEWATDYYHRPPAPKPHHYKHHKSDYKYKKPEHDKHHEDKKHVDKKHDKHHEDRGHVDKRNEHDRHHDVSKNEIRKDRPSHDVVKQNRTLPFENKKVNKIERKQIDHRIFRRH